MERSNNCNDNAGVEEEEKHQSNSKSDDAAAAAAAQKGKGIGCSGSPIKISSIYIELNASKGKNIAEKCEHFTIRGYVSQVREEDINKCWPFDSSDLHSKVDCDDDEDDRELPPLDERKFRYWRCTNCLQIIGQPVETRKHAALPLRPSRSTSKSKTIPYPIPTVDASPMSLSLRPPSKLVNLLASKDIQADTSECERLNTAKRRDKANVCGSSTSGQTEGSKHRLNGEIAGLSSVIAKICSDTMQITCPEEDSDREVAGADDPSRNVDCVFKNSVGIFETEKETSSHEQIKEVIIAHAKSVTSGQLADTCSPKKGNSGAQDILEADDRGFVSSNSAEIVVKNKKSLKGPGRSSGQRRRKTRKIRLLTELLCENGIGNGDAPKSADRPSSVIIPEASAGVDKPPGSPSRASIEGDARRGLLPNKKRKVPQDYEWSPPEMNAASRVIKEAKTSKKAVDMTKMDAAAPPDVVADEKDQLVSSKIRNESSAGKGKRVANIESAVNSELVADVKNKSGKKNKSSKTRGENGAVMGKKKNKNISVAHEHLSLAPPSWEKSPTETEPSIGDASKAKTADGAVPISLKNQYAGREIDLFPLPAQRVDGKSGSPQKQLKSGQFDDFQGRKISSNLNMPREDLATQGVDSRIQTWPAHGAAKPVENLSSEKELNLSLDIYPTTHKSEKPFNSVESRQSSLLDGHVRTSKDRFMGQDGQKPYLEMFPTTHRSQLLAPCSGVQSDPNRKQPILGLPFLGGTKNYNSPVTMGGFLMPKKDCRSTSTHEKTAGIQEHIAARREDIERRAVMASEQGASDDIPMEIVELMAKNQYERCLPDAQAERYRTEAANSSIRGQTVDFGKVYRHLNMHPFYQEAYKEKLLTNNGRNGIIQWGENVRATKQKSVAQFPQADQNRFFIYPPEQNRPLGGYGEFQPRQKPLNMEKISASSSGGPIGDQNWRWFGDVSMKGPSQTSSRPTGPWNECQNIPPQSKDAYHVWRTSAPTPSHNLPFMYNVPQKSASTSTRMDGFFPSGSMPKSYINRDNLNQNVASLQKQGNGLDSEMPGKTHLENPFTRKHHNGIELNQKPAGNLDLYSDETMSAMHLLSLMDAGLRSNGQANQDGESKLFKRPPASLERHSGIDSTSHKEKSQLRNLPYGFVSKNQHTRGFHASGITPTIGSSSTSFQLDRVFNKDMDLSIQGAGNRSGGLPQASASTSSGFKIPSGSGVVHTKQTTRLGPSDSFRIPFQIPTLKPPKGRILDVSRTPTTECSSKRKLEPEVCRINRNPADFSYPGPGNPYMIGAQDLRFLDADRAKHKRQKKKLPATRGRGPPPRLNPRTC